MSACVRGTLHIAIDTHFSFSQDFTGKYKPVNFKYWLGKPGYTDCLVAAIAHSVEETYNIITEMVSVLSYTMDKAFIIHGHIFDQFHGQLSARKPGYSQRRMLQHNEGYASNVLYFPPFPVIETEWLSNLIRMYRLAKTEEHINNISSFLFYYHILDYKGENNAASGAADVIESFRMKDQDSRISKLIEAVNDNRAFAQQNTGNEQESLGKYIQCKVRNSIAHIIREPNKGAHNIKIDSFAQTRHLSELVDLMRVIARDKLETYIDGKYAGDDIFWVEGTRMCCLER